MKRRLLILALALVGVLNGLTLYGWIVSSATVSDLRATQRNSCSRVNVLRAQSNLSNITSFRALSYAKLPQFATELYVTGLTNCDEAVRNPHYRYPVAKPIGNAKTGTLYKLTQQIEADSLVARALNER